MVNRHTNSSLVSKSVSNNLFYTPVGFIHNGEAGLPFCSVGSPICFVWFLQLMCIIPWLDWFLCLDNWIHSCRSVSTQCTKQQTAVEVLSDARSKFAYLDCSIFPLFHYTCLSGNTKEEYSIMQTKTSRNTLMYSAVIIASSMILLLVKENECKQF